MNLQDFSNGFDTLVSSYSKSSSFGETMPDIRFDEYEKSQFLTKAQEEEVLSLYNGKNPYRESFESTEEMRRYLAPLVKEAELSPLNNAAGSTFDETYDDTFQNDGKKYIGIDDASAFFQLPEDLWFITYESVRIDNGKCEGMKSLDVYPVTQDEYHKIKKNPFRGANDRRALRLDLFDGGIEIVSKYNVIEYYIRYLRKLKPILLIDLDEDNMELNGYNKAQDCELHETLHQRILERAVIMALQSKGIGYNENK